MLSSQFPPLARAGGGSFIFVCFHLSGRPTPLKLGQKQDTMSARSKGSFGAKFMRSCGTRHCSCPRV